MTNISVPFSPLSGVLLINQSPKNKSNSPDKLHPCLTPVLISNYSYISPWSTIWRLKSSWKNVHRLLPNFTMITHRLSGHVESKVFFPPDLTIFMSLFARSAGKQKHELLWGERARESWERLRYCEGAKNITVSRSPAAVRPRKIPRDRKQKWGLSFAFYSSSELRFRKYDFVRWYWTSHCISVCFVCFRKNVCFAAFFYPLGH